MRRLFSQAKGRTARDIALAVATAGSLALVSIIAWRALPHFGANGRLMLGLVSAICTYQLTNGGDGKRNLSVRTVAWLGPVLLLQLAFQALVTSGYSTLD